MIKNIDRHPDLNLKSKKLQASHRRKEKQWYL